MGGKTANTTKPRAARGEAGSFSETFAAQLLMGGLFTVGFYGLVAIMPAEWTFFRRYFCSHPLEYATTGLFFIAMGTLLLKFVQHNNERSQLRGAVASKIAESKVSQLDLEEAIQQSDPSAKRTWFVRRLRDASAFVRSRGTGSGIEDHLRYLGELASDQLHRSYAFVRTITWAVPILGFLGTVMGITMAIANVTPEQLDSSLGDVTGGLAVAFDTTALALALSILLVFASFLVERCEQQLLAEVEDFSIRHLPGVYGTGSADGHVAVSGIEPATAKILADALDAVATRQTAIWEEQLGEMRTRWESLLLIAENQGQLIRLEEQLHTNLEAIRTSETFDQTLNNLTAAVHLLSTRTNAAAPQPHRRAA
ncbi:MAG: MotA/TolQ/ExbB proton channel family protein [Planctomycetaceae bacterium]